MTTEGWWIARRGIVQHRPETREEWLRLRTSWIGASEAGALIGVHDFTSTYELWARKSGLLPPLDQTEVMLRGELLEDDALELIRRRHPEWTLIHNLDHVCFEDPINRLGATPDVFAVIDDRPAVIEIKTTDPMTFRDKWMREGTVVEPPLWIAVQAMLTAYLIGAERAFVAVMSVGRTLDLTLVEIPIKLGVLARLQKRARAFWKAVDDNLPPDPDYERDGEAIAALLPQDDGSEIDLSADNEFCAAVISRCALKREIERAMSELGRHEALIRHKIGAAAKAIGPPGHRITNKLQRRRSYTVAATEFRKLVISEDKP